MKLKKVTNGLSRERRYAEHRVPPPHNRGDSEANRYPERRLRAIVLTVVSSGIRLGAWDFLKRKHILPIKIKEDGEAVVAKIIVSPGIEDHYFHL